jgi:glycosyltransferase involved in cell wall biosynthesis
VGFSGKIVQRKRPQDLLAAVRSLNRPDVCALYIGAGALEDEIRQSAGDFARFTGFVNQAEMPKVLALCDILAMPSEHDAHPIIVTEAECLGIPVVLSDLCGCYGPGDVFRDGESGILYPCGDVRRLAEALARLVDSPETRSRMGARARELADLHSVQASADSYIAAANDAIRKAASHTDN